ncbi:4-(cytidine 5'-diphospho)-2-C-methyl-D-erythritol kinase [Ruania albidiflava]|uniref:4-(cytidine 5'-diphospho)-2-C-methyl-D-erythritol kinase n=1 Tax=Ruania albidiflava TaxID=366586 RepID=UPI0003B6B22C|nr:4-(cytidine 5'-diphospho)-2-C-methyl-D-erythritol kinase [Ruania albidiflava]
MNTSVMLPAVHVRAPGMLTLVLRVGPAGADGDHQLATVYQAVSLHEDVVATPAEEITVSTTGPWADRVADDETNLACRAARLLAEASGTSTGVHLQITKRVPVGGGMAGGSADAAAALLACDLLWQTGLAREELGHLAAELGADVPFALTGGTAVALGRGDRLTPALARGCYHWVLGIRAQGLSTGEVFTEWDRLHPDPEPVPHIDDAVMAALISGDPHRLAEVLGNDLDDAAGNLAPAVQQVQQVLADSPALASLVAGSGPTVAALAPDHPTAVEIAETLRTARVADHVEVVTGPAPGARLLESVREDEA